MRQEASIIRFLFRAHAYNEIRKRKQREFRKTKPDRSTEDEKDEEQGLVTVPQEENHLTQREDAINNSKSH